MRCLLRSKIHRATVTEANVEYVGSITIDRSLLAEADIWAGEKVLVSDVDNGSRFETYVVPGDSGIICVNGAAARLVDVGDRVIIMSFEYGNTPIEPKIILVDEKNRCVQILKSVESQPLSV